MKTTFSRISGMTADQRATVADRFDKAARLAAAEPVAVVGVGCRFPGDVSGPQQYWELLAGGRDAITEVPQDRWDADAFYDPDPSAPARMTSKWGGFLSDVSGFDADFFGISPREAAAMDPQQRLLLEVAWEALEHAGFPPDRLNGIRAAVMMGLYYTEYQAAAAADPAAIDAYSATGNAHSVAVGRIAYLLGLHGPAVAVDTACSSSLVSVHLACQSLRMRESEIALAGGVNLILRPETQLALSKWGMLSPRGRCHSFDAAADGFVRGEGCGVVVLKRLTDAVRDGDRVLAVVRGSALNQDGRSNGLTAPNAFAQRDVITRALWSADVPAASINYVETHGTGTALGDPIEFDALASIYGHGDGPCAMGAVKTNFGHLEAAAGIAGFIKTVLALQHAQIPQNLHFTTFNPAIDPSDTRLFVPTATTAWPQSDGPRRAGVSSFGLGGTNAHVVVEQGPDVVGGVCDSGVGSGGVSGSGVGVVSTLVVSGKSEARVASWAGVLADWLEGVGGGVGLAEVAHSVNHHRSRFVKFGSVCARDRVGAVAGLRALASGRSGPGVVGPHRGVCGSGTVFVYSGQGSQWAGMGRRLLVDEPVFAAAVAELEPVFVGVAGFSLQGVLGGGEALVGIDRIQPVLVGVQLALTRLWRAYGVHPDAVIGHSMGEVAAAVVSGALSVEQGLQVIVARSRLMARLSGRGAMALLELDAAGVEAVLADFPQVGVAVYASPRQTVVAGPPDEVDAVVGVVDGRGLLARRVEVDVASHHRTVDPILGELRAQLGGLVSGVGSIPVFSTTGGGAGGFDADYWVANLREPVRFTQAVAAAAKDHATFIEISPHPLLTHAITDTLESRSRDTRVSATLYRDTDETLSFHTQLAGVRPPAEAATAPGTLVDLPATPWEHTRFWMTSRPAGRSAPGTHPLLGTHVEMPSGSDHVWQADVGTALFPWLSDHRVHGQVVMPAAGIAEMALAAGGQALGVPAETIAVRRLEVEQMLPLGEQTQVTTQLTRTPGGAARVELHSRSAVGAWTRHAVAQVEVVSGATPPQPPAWGADGPETVAVGEFYSALRRTGAHHGPAFAALTRIERTGGGVAESHITLPDAAGAHQDFHLHPVLLDAALQTLAAAMPAPTPGDAGEVTYLPVSIENIRMYAKAGRRARCRAELTSLDERGAGQLGRIVLADEDGTVTAEITGVYLRRVERRTVPLPLEQKVFDTTWREVAPSVHAPSGTRAGSWLLLCDGADAAAAADRFGAAFGSPERRVIRESLFDEPAVHNAFAAAAADPQRPPVGIVVFIGDRGTDGEAVEKPQAAGELILAVTGALRAVVGGWHGKSPRLWLVSRGGLAVGTGEAGSPAVGALRGLVRVLTYEHPDLQATLLDLDPDADDPTALMTELTAPGNDDVIAWRAGRRFAERLSRAALPPRREEPAVRADGSYVLTGGLGGLGLVVARWLLDKGAGRVILNGRSEPSDEQRGALTALAGHGDVAYVAGDIAAPGVAERLVAAAEQSGLPLRGVLHGAAVLDDGLATAVTRDSLERVWAPKAAGALRLHEATADHPLDWWVAFSSVAALLGSPGQAAYASANAWLDALVWWRRAAGLPASTINWGQWSDVGLARAMTFGALDPISPAEGIEALETLLGRDLPRAGVARLRLDRAAAAFPEIKNVGYFADMVAESDEMSSGGEWPGPQALAELDAADVARVVVERLRERTSAIMGYPDPTAVDADQPLTEIGMDSLMAVRIRNAARADFGVDPPVALLLQGATLRDLAGDLMGQLGHGAQEPQSAPDGLRGRAEQRARQRAQARQQAASRRKAGHRA